MVAGVLIPGMVVGALIIIPYFNINIEGRSIWAKPSHRPWVITAVPVFLLVIFLLFDVKQLVLGESVLPLVDRVLDLIVPLVPTALVGGVLALFARVAQKV